MPWTIADMPDVSGKVVLITGCTSGIGLAAARQFVRRGAKLVMANRNANKAAAVADSFRSEFPAADIVPLPLDTSNLDSVRAFADAFDRAAIPAIDILMLNAGAVHTDGQRSAQGLERTFATNHLGHWLLTGLLLKHVLRAKSPRIVVVSSVAHYLVSDIDYDAVRTSTAAYDINYGMSKLANLLFVRALNQRLRAAGARSARAVACHPGSTRTALFDDARLGPFYKLFVRVVFALGQDCDGGALPLLMAATDVGASGDEFYVPGWIFEIRGNPRTTGFRTWAARNDEKADRLWAESEAMTGFKYSF